MTHIFLTDVSYNAWYLMSCVKQDLIRPHTFLFILSQFFSEISSGFSFNHRVSSRFDVVNASITSHLHISKLFVPSNFTTSIFIRCGFMNFTVDWLSLAIFLIDSSIQCKKQLVKTKLNRKDQIFISERKCRQFPSWFVLPERKLPDELRKLGYHLLGI